MCHVSLPSSISSTTARADRDARVGLGLKREWLIVGGEGGEGGGGRSATSDAERLRSNGGRRGAEPPPCICILPCYLHCFFGKPKTAVFSVFLDPTHCLSQLGLISSKY